MIPIRRLRRCLHDTRSSFIPVRLHPGSILSIYICLHDTNQNCIPERVVPERLHPGSRIGSKFSFQNEICLHVPSVSCKGGTGSFRYGNKQVDWLGWPADSCFRSVDAFTAFSFQNENVYVNVKQTMRVVLERNSFRYHVNTTWDELFFWIWGQDELWAKLRLCLILLSARLCIRRANRRRITHLSQTDNSSVEFIPWRIIRLAG